MNNSWSRPLWKEIKHYILSLEEPIEHDSVIDFLNYVESKIKCGKCKKHFKEFPRPNFTDKESVEKWFQELNSDIKKQKNKVTPTIIKPIVKKSNRFSKIV
jgi:hypothetical protein